MNSKPLFTVPLNAEVLIKHMCAAKPGDMFTYQFLSSKIGGEDPRKVWLSVKRVLRQEYNLIFDCVKSKGWQCLTHVEIIDKGAGVRRKIKRIAVNRLKEMKVIDPAKLGNDDRRKYSSELAITGLIQSAASEEARQHSLKGKVLSINQGPTLESLKAAFA